MNLSLVARRSSLVLLLLVVTATACRNHQDITPQSHPNPQRIVSLKPNLTEILFALGAGERVVGVTEHCLWPQEAQTRPKIGGYAQPDLEKIMALKPELLVTLQEDSSPRIIEVLTAAKIPVLVLQTRTIKEIYQSIRKLAKVLQLSEPGETLIQEMKSGLQRLAEQAPEATKKRGLLVIQRRPLIIAGHDTFLDEMLRAAGAENVAPSSRLHYPRISMEEVLAWQPDVIFDLDTSSEQETWQGFQSLPAGQKGQIFSVNPDLFTPGPRLVRAAAILAQHLYGNTP